MPEAQPSIEGVRGFRAAGVQSGIKKSGALDFALIVSDRPCSASGVFTTSYVKAAPVLVDMEHLSLRAGSIRAVVTNSGCANACTGQQGMDNARQMARLTADKIDCAEQDVLVLSTGVIGVQLPMDKIERGINLALDTPEDDWFAAARAIMTTDTRPKMASVTVTTSSGQSYRIAGICKGAGMIAPNMATMLSVVVTDAQLTPEQTRSALKAAAKISYNCIVVDGDTSTNDTVFLLANGASGAAPQSETDLAQFQEALDTVCTKLAQDVVRDGEGVTKFITVRVEGAPDDAAARQIANTVAISPLVKTAFYGNDANWGRILMAAGRAGVPFDQNRVSLWFAPGEAFEEPLQLVADGMPLNYSETQATAIISQPSVGILLNCGAGAGAATVWTCDFSHEYVSINADYRT
ncbi:MAG: bifunctional glutamate N-acetyltransferase/amino-acid acetyltransferase ArgJ [Anaerolineae bacterium]|nr:bifunctional glutamate N-acetyltransferase/amino-acid acetyltransferase ArgJ [Anaerolineae bacterium]